MSCEYKISCVYFPALSELEFSFEKKETGEVVYLHKKCSEKEGISFAKLIPPCVYSEAEVKDSYAFKATEKVLFKKMYKEINANGAMSKEIIAIYHRIMNKLKRNIALKKKTNLTIQETEFLYFVLKTTEEIEDLDED